MDPHSHREFQFDRPGADRRDPGSASADAAPVDASGAAGDQVLGILADIEQQLERLRSVQGHYDEQFASLAARSNAVEQAERTLQDESAKLREQQAEAQQQRQALDKQQQEIEALEAQRQQIETQRQALDTQRRQANEQLAEAQARVEQSRRQLDQQGSQIAQQQSELAEERAEFQSTRAGFFRQRQQLESEQQDRLAELDRREAQLTCQQEELQAERDRLCAVESQRQEFERQSQRVEELQGRLERAKSKINDMAGQFDRSERELDEKTRQLEAVAGQTDTLRSRAGELEQALGEANSRAAQAEEQAEAEIASLTEQVRRLNTQREHQEASLAEHRKELDLAGEKMSQLSEALDKQQPQLERGAAAQAMVQQQRQRIEQLTAQLAAHQVGSAPKEIRRKDQRIVELVEALRQARGQSPGDRDVAELEQRIEQLTAEGERWKVAAERAAIEAEQAKRQLERNVASAGREECDKDREIATLTAQVERLQGELRSQREQAAEAESADGEQARTPDDSAERQRKALAEHAQLRAREAQELDDQRQRLGEVRKFLAASEQKMRRKWARSRAAVVLAWLGVSAGIIAIGSWVAASHFFPATVSASVDLEAKASPGRPISDEDAAGWQRWHAGMLADAGFHKTLAKRLADQRIDAYKDPTVLARRLRDDLTVDATERGELTLTLAGTNPREITALLDTLAATLARESSRQAGKRSDGARTIVRGERREAGRIHYASINPVPILDQRLVYAAGIFAAGFTLSLLLGLLIYLRLVRAKRVFDEPEAMIAAADIYGGSAASDG